MHANVFSLAATDFSLKKPIFKYWDLWASGDLGYELYGFIIFILCSFVVVFHVLKLVPMYSVCVVVRLQK